MDGLNKEERWSSREGRLLSWATGDEVFMAYVGWNSLRLVPTSIRPGEVAFAYRDTHGERKCIHYMMSNGMVVIRPVED